MGIKWLWAAVVYTILVCTAADRGGSSLRGALEALQRRQRGRVGHGPIVPESDYDAFYEFVPPQPYSNSDYGIDVEDLDEEPTPKYLIKFLENSDRHPEAYEYRVVKKKYSPRMDPPLKESAFRERTHVDNEGLRDLFMDNNEVQDKKDSSQERVENDAEYAILLSQLWSKYKNSKSHANKEDSVPQGVVHLYKDKVVKKRMPDNWGPIAFKRKRSSESNSVDRPNFPEYEGDRKQDTAMDNSNYNAYEVSGDDNDDLREEYAIAFQPLDDDSLSDIADDESYAVDPRAKRFPVTKRSSGPYDMQRKRSIQRQEKRDTARKFRSSSGTDPKTAKDLSTIFGQPDNKLLKSPVKRNSDHHTHEAKPPNLTILSNNSSHDKNNTLSAIEQSHSHENDGHNMHHPGLSGKDEMETTESNEDKPISIQKKSINWSDYFGIDKRKKKSFSNVNDLSEDRLKKQYFDTFNKEVIYPLNSFRKHNYVKRNFLQNKPREDGPIQIGNERDIAVKDDKSNNANDNDSKLDNIDKKLKNMEDIIVDEALHYTNNDDEDSKEDRETKEKLLSRLAAAYSLEKMRKALKEFKQSLQMQRNSRMKPSQIPADEVKAKRVAIKKEKVEITNNEIPNFNKNQVKDDFEDEQGAGHYLNGKMEEYFSEGYMGGSGRNHYPVMSKVGATGSCPVLARIVQRCHGVDMLAGDRGQLFLPLCSLHQICYLCGETPPTTCDLVYLSEADTTCGGDVGCQRAARSALMALRELHDNLADELDGECEANPCLSTTLKLNVGWQRALQR